MNALRKSLYRLTEAELIEQIKKECISEGVPFKTDELGNIWSIRFEDKPIFVAHMDTVIGDDEFYKAPLLIHEGKLSRPGYVLGADDRAGVNLILNHKHKINFVFTVQEEVGCVGAKKLSTNKEFIDDTMIGTFFIELDRKGISDIIGNRHGYCESGLIEAIQKVLPAHKDTWGIYTDIDSFKNISQGINLSVGYFNPHTSKEYLDIEYFEFLDTKIEELANIEGFRATYKPPVSSRLSYGRKDYAYDQYFRNDNVCDFCGMFSDITYDYHGFNVCEACAAGIPDEELYENGDVLDTETEKCGVCGGSIFDFEDRYRIEAWGITVCEDCMTVKKGKEWL